MIKFRIRTDAKFTTMVNKNKRPATEYKKFNHAMRFFNSVLPSVYFRLTIVKNDKEKTFIICDLDDGMIPKQKTNNCIRLRKNIFARKSCIRKTTKRHENNKANRKC